VVDSVETGSINCIAQLQINENPFDFDFSDRANVFVPEEKKLGLWDDAMPIPPLEFRKK